MLINERNNASGSSVLKMLAVMVGFTCIALLRMFDTHEHGAGGDGCVRPAEWFGARTRGSNRKPCSAMANATQALIQDDGHDH